MQTQCGDVADALCRRANYSNFPLRGRVEEGGGAGWLGGTSGEEPMNLWAEWSGRRHFSEKLQRLDASVGDPGRGDESSARRGDSRRGHSLGRGEGGGWGGGGTATPATATLIDPATFQEQFHRQWD